MFSIVANALASEHTHFHVKPIGIYLADEIGGALIDQNTDVLGPLIQTTFANLRSLRVKPLGTIIMCFPHVDEETKSVLQSVMEEAENYADFTERLCDKVFSEQVSLELQYFACYHAYNLENFAQIDRFFKLDEISVYIEPLLLAIRVYKGEPIDLNVINESLTKAMEVFPNDWLACHLYLAWRRMAISFIPDTDTVIKTMEAIGERIKKDKDFECFESLFIGFKAYRIIMEGNLTEAVHLVKKVLSLARKHDELLLAADALYFLADIIMYEDVSQAIGFILEQKKLCEQIGYEYGLARNSGSLGRIMTLRGEYDAGISYQLDYSKASESIGHPDAYLNLRPAFVYNLIRNGRKALEHSEVAKGKTDGRKRTVAYYYLQLAYAMINLGNEKEALNHLDTAKQLAVQSGWQAYLDLHQLLEGIMEKESGDFQSATDTFESLIKRCSEGHLYKNLCFFHLSDIEVETYSSEQVVLSESWLHRFEIYVEERDYPGFVAQAKILKAKLLLKQGEHEKSQALVNEVLKVAESPSMKYLREMIALYLPEISS